MKTLTQVLALSLALFTTNCLASNLIGTIIPPSFDSWSETHASCVADCSHSIGVLNQGNQQIVYLSKTIPTGKAELLMWEITDQLPYLEAGRGLTIVYGVCELDGQLDTSIIALLQPSDSEWTTNIRTAYRANIETERFEPLLSNGIRCQNLEWAG